MSLSAILREAKGLHQSLKELIKAKEPFDKEVDFQRKNLRRRYLNLLLVHPAAKESKDVENHLWMQTSYAFIASYKQRIALLDPAKQNHQRNQQQQGPPKAVEHRKLVQRFRQFLADEEKFWTQVLLRLLRLFDLHEAKPALIALGLLNEVDEVVPVPDGGTDGVVHGVNGRNHFQFPPEDTSISFAPTTSEEREARLATLSKALICLGDIARYRELYNESNGRPRAGHEDAGPARRGRNRRGGAPEAAPRPRNYDKAQQCYEQARLLVPDDGNASHQLAILSSYQKDSFASLFHYYRALCVRQPYDTAAENLGTVLTKALDSWRQRMRREKDKIEVSDGLSPRARIDLLKEKVVILHALWRVGMEKGVDKMKYIGPKHNEKVAADFYALVSERHLPIDMISNTIVLSQGALWKHRMIRDSPASHHHRKSEVIPVPAGTASVIEWCHLDHLLDLHFALMEVGKDELKDPPSMDGADDLAQRISAVFRRTLPALRIASKWLRANFKYVAQDQEFVAFQLKEKLRGVDVQKRHPHKISGYSSKTQKFWKTYAQFTLALSQAFPAQKLPALLAPLEEDVELRGFLPLRNLMGEDRKSGGKALIDDGQPREQVHPNVEQLMRIADLLDDAKALANMENSPLDLFNNHIVFKLGSVEDVQLVVAQETAPGVNEAPLPIHQQQLLVNIRDNSLDLHPRRDPEADDMTELTSRTDDDLVREAFWVVDKPEVIADEDEDDEDEIVYMRSSLSPAISPILQATPATPVKPLLSPIALSPRSPTHYQAPRIPSFTLPAAVPAPTTTAQDLLNNVMGTGVGNRTTGGSLHQSIEQPKFLFGNELSHRPSQSIWSASRDEQSLMYSGNVNSPNGHGMGPANGHANIGGMHNTTHSLSGGNGHAGPNLLAGGSLHGSSIYQTSPRQYSAVPVPQDLSLSQQSIWSSSYSSNNQNSQQSLIGGLPSAPFAPPPQMSLGGQQHQRLPSASIASQLYSNQNIAHSTQDPFSYTSPVMHQAPIQRPEPNLTSSGYLSSSLGHGSLPPVGAASGIGLGLGGPSQHYYTSPNPGYHSRQASLHDPRIGQQNYMAPAISQVWGNPG